MKIRQLIEELTLIEAKHPGINVSVFDWRKNLGGDYGDGSYEGIYSEFNVGVIKLDGEEHEFYKEQNDDKEFTPWVALEFVNEDYNDSGVHIETDENYQ